jgi:hypothetical protein
MKMPKRRQKQKQRQKRKKKQKIVKLDTVELDGILRRAEAELDKEDYELLRALVESYVYVTDLVEDKTTTIARLRKLLFGSGSEKTSDVFRATGDDTEATAGQEAATEDGAAPTPDSDQEHASETPKREGHGRNGADAYRGAKKIRVPHESLQPVLRGIHGRGTRGGGLGEVRCDCGEHDCPAEVREWASLQSIGRPAGESGYSSAGLDPVGHRQRRRQDDRAGLR